MSTNVFRVVVVEGTKSLLDGVYVREEGELEWIARLNPHAFVNQEDAESCAALIAKFLTDVQKWT